MNDAGSIFQEIGVVPEQSLRTYAGLWQFEVWLRRVVYVELRALLGDNWGQDLPTASKPLDADKRLSHMSTPEMLALSYVSLGQLTGVVTKHWDCFELYLPPRNLWDAKMEEIAQIRHRVAHFREGHVDDYSRLRQFMRDLDQGFWRFCTSYNDTHPILPQNKDAVTDHFLPFDALPWVEFEENKWARSGLRNKSLTVSMDVTLQGRPWASSFNPKSNPQGILYDCKIIAEGQRGFDYEAFLEKSRDQHRHMVHICLDSFADTVRLTIPAVLGAPSIIGILERMLEIAANSVGPQQGNQAAAIQNLARKWPEYVIDDQNPLSFLAPDMPCSFFGGLADK